MGPKGRWVEVQVRSERMDEIAEKYAAHYKYTALQKKAV
jgi:GTP pyrophosphokinase